MADLGCGAGWSSIAIARPTRSVRVDGFDADAASIEAARANAAAAGGSAIGSASTSVTPASPPLAGAYDLVTIFEALHDMARPVEALRATRAAARGRRARARRRRARGRAFTAPGDDLERLMYGFSVVHCLPVGLADHEDSAATGTAMRPEHLPRLRPATPASQTSTILPIDNDFWRFYRLDP